MPDIKRKMDRKHSGKKRLRSKRDDGALSPSLKKQRGTDAANPVQTQQTNGNDKDSYDSSSSDNGNREIKRRYDEFKDHEAFFRSSKSLIDDDEDQDVDHNHNSLQSGYNQSRSDPYNNRGGDYASHGYHRFDHGYEYGYGYGASHGYHRFDHDYGNGYGYDAYNEGMIPNEDTPFRQTMEWLQKRENDGEILAGRHFKGIMHAIEFGIEVITNTVGDEMVRHNYITKLLLNFVNVISSDANLWPWSPDVKKLCDTLQRGTGSEIIALLQGEAKSKKRRKDHKRRQKKTKAKTKKRSKRNGDGDNDNKSRKKQSRKKKKKDITKKNAKKNRNTGRGKAKKKGIDDSELLDLSKFPK